ncbi:uncharacterized protein LOC121995935 [Zingiber officinale]|uniref:uncharacterized protein LOC121995935 n=1 Tax=Zingiber officinale TaxID=94328 RepID=UPI001C4BC160|nr:uncharacterized protein LOC121995935 [Zingiber officinale]
MQTTEKRQAREGYKWRNPAISKDFKPPPPLLLPQSQGLFDSESFLPNFIAIGGELKEEAFAESEMVFDHESSLKELNLKNKRVMGGGWSEEGAGRWPPWLRPLLATRFFAQCELHAEVQRSECNMYCLDCAGGALCSLCLAHRHRDHLTIQIRRSSYHDVIRVSEIQKVLDISGVQTYIINSARIVFLNERPQPRPGKGVNNTCEVCDRSLLDSFRFCSLGCKLASTGTRTSKKNSPLRRQTTAPVSESEDSFASSSRGSVRMQRSTPSASPPATGARRRKGIPQRAPFSTQ